MTTISTTAAFDFSKNMFSNPEMRPYLKEYYEESYSSFRDHLAQRKAAEENGDIPQTIRTPDGRTGTIISASRMEAAIPTFDKWLDMQQNGLSVFDWAAQNGAHLATAQNSIQRLEEDLNPDNPSNVRVIFSDGAKILGYINEDGSVVSHDGAGSLQKIAQQANEKGLFGDAKIAYIQKHAKAELSAQHGNLKITTYTHDTTPTRRAFMAAWYPGSNIDELYQSTLNGAKESLAQHEKLYQQSLQNLNNLRTALLQIRAEMENQQTKPTTVA